MQASLEAETAPSRHPEGSLGDLKDLGGGFLSYAPSLAEGAVVGAVHRMPPGTLCGRPGWGPAVTPRRTVAARPRGRPCRVPSASYGPPLRKRGRARGWR